MAGASGGQPLRSRIAHRTERVQHEGRVGRRVEVGRIQVDGAIVVLGLQQEARRVLEPPEQTRISVAA